MLPSRGVRRNPSAVSIASAPKNAALGSSSPVPEVCAETASPYACPRTPSAVAGTPARAAIACSSEAAEGDSRRPFSQCPVLQAAASRQTDDRPGNAGNGRVSQHQACMRSGVSIGAP